KESGRYRRPGQKGGRADEGDRPPEEGKRRDPEAGHGRSEKGHRRGGTDRHRCRKHPRRGQGARRRSAESLLPDQSPGAPAQDLGKMLKTGTDKRPAADTVAFTPLSRQDLEGIVADEKSRAAELVAHYKLIATTR